jgi:hypothetical protein
MKYYCLLLSFFVLSWVILVLHFVPMEKWNNKLTNTEVATEDDLQPSVSPLVCLGVGSHLEPMTRFLFSVWQLWVSWSGRPIWWEDRSVIYCTIASRPCQSSHSWVQVLQNSRPYFTISYETPPTWRARSPYLYPPGTGWPSYTPGHWVPFSSSLMTHRATLEVF